MHSKKRVGEGEGEDLLRNKKKERKNETRKTIPLFEKDRDKNVKDVFYLLVKVLSWFS